MDDANPVISLLLREFRRQASAKTEETNLQVTFPITLSSGLNSCCLRAPGHSMFIPAVLAMKSGMHLGQYPSCDIDLIADI